MNAALRAMGFLADEITGHARIPDHGANDAGGASQHPGSRHRGTLAHAVKDNLGRAYNRTEFISERRAMMQT